MKRIGNAIVAGVIATIMAAGLVGCGSSTVSTTSSSESSESSSASSTAAVSSSAASESASSSSNAALSGNSEEVAAVSSSSSGVPVVAGTDDTSILQEDYTAKSNYKIGFALQTMDVDVFNTMSQGMEDEAKKIGVDYTCMVANNDVATQVSNIENMIAQGYNAIIIHTFDKEAFATVANEAIDKGIVVCAYDDNIIDPATGEPCKYPLTFLCNNYDIGYRVGTMAAEWTKKQFPDETGDLEFGLLWHHEYEFQQERVKGIRAAIAEKDPRIKIVDEQEGLVTEDGVKACEAWTQSYPDLKGVVATNDTALLGFAQAWQSAGKDVHDETFGMFGNDGVNDAIDMVADDTIMRGDVGLDVYDGGAMALLACTKELDGVPTESVLMPMVNCTVDNVQEDWISNPTLYVKK
ncbi:sugar ABC transporter substrate-binding protein [Bilifractor porci]|nr:sugar ABC transporter substrate-binding protein [Bilifractor porci]